MFEQDYIMRIIKEMVRALLKMLFNIDTESPTADILENVEEKCTLNELIDMVDAGNINEAENSLYDIIQTDNLNTLKIALLFYSYLNEQNDDFLEEHNFSRDEIQEGIKSLVSKYGLTDIAVSFLE